MLMKNVSGGPLRVPADLVREGEAGAIVIESGEEVEIRGGYGYPSRAGNGSRAKSIAERLAPGLVPADEEYRVEWEKVPVADWVPPKDKVTADQYVAMGMSPGLAALRKAKEEAEAVVVEPEPEPEPVVEVELEPEPPPKPKKRKRGRPKKVQD